MAAGESDKKPPDPPPRPPEVVPAGGPPAGDLGANLAGGDDLSNLTDRRFRQVLVLVLLASLYLVAWVGYAAWPSTTGIGYAPVQPIPFSHALHAGKLGLDCRYCHSGALQAAVAGLPPSQTCMNCHWLLFPEARSLEPLRVSFQSGQPVAWRRVYQLPGYVYFNHGAHTRAGVGCAACHGPVSHTDQLSRVSTLAMGWCLECHRNPEPALDPPRPSRLTSLSWKYSGVSKPAVGGVHPSTDCVTCHR